MFSLDEHSGRRSGAMHMPMQRPATLGELATAVAQYLVDDGQLPGLQAHCEALGVHPAVREALTEAAALGVDEGQAWHVCINPAAVEELRRAYDVLLAA